MHPFVSFPQFKFLAKNEHAISYERIPSCDTYCSLNKILNILWVKYCHESMSSTQQMDVSQAAAHREISFEFGHKNYFLATANNNNKILLTFAN